MAGSPFEIFRRNQRQLMVVLTGLAMFSFIFLDVATNQSGRMSVSMGMLLLAALFASGLWFVGSSRGKGTEYALWGALIGAVAGFIGFQDRSTGAVAQTSIGSFSRNDLQLLAQRRGIANRFAAMASKGMSGGMFGGTDDRSLVMRAILLSEAQQRGIAVTDEGVNEFIQQITNKQLPLPEYKQLLRDIGLGDAELFDILREELAARLVLEMDLPPRQRFGQGTVQTPLSYWKQFQMLQVRQALDAVELPVEAFVSLVPEPTDQDLSTFFEAFKNKLPSNDGKPGFLRDRQVQLAYVAADFEAFERLVTEPTDAEVEEFYQTNKQRYQVPVLPESPGRGQPEDAAPASALDPANVPKESSAPIQPPPPTLPEPGDNGEGCGGQEPAEQPESKVPTFPELTLPPPSRGAFPPGSGFTGGATAPELKYRELDDGLKLEIRETMLKQRAFAKMAEAADRALEEMTKLADVYLAVTDDASRVKTAAQLSDTMKAYAEQNKLLYVETKPLTQQELMSSLEEPIGQAMEPRANPFSRGETVAADAFSNDTLFNPRRVDSILRDKTYAYWKIADTPARVPDFKEVKDQVTSAWKLERAKPLAQKRAQELVELVKSSGKPMTEALSGQTITGETESPAVTVKQTSRFTWLNVPRTLPFQFNQGPQMPQISVVDGVKRPGNEFMQIVFEELGPGETGVAPNQSYSDFYVVQVKQRDATPAEDGDNLGLRALQQQFLVEGRTGFFSSAYMVLAAMPQNEFMNRWQDGFEKRYSVVWSDKDEAAQQAEP